MKRFYTSEREVESGPNESRKKNNAPTYKAHLANFSSILLCSGSSVRRRSIYAKVWVARSSDGAEYIPKSQHSTRKNSIKRKITGNYANVFFTYEKRRVASSYNRN